MLDTNNRILCNNYLDIQEDWWNKYLFEYSYKYYEGLNFRIDFYDSKESC